MALTFSVLVTDNISGSGLQPLREDSQFELVEINDSSSTDFRNALPSADGLIVRSATKVDSDMLAEAQSLKVIGRAGVGVDNIDLDAATERGIAVLNAPAGNTVSAAELTLALMLSVVRRVPGADASVRRGEWDRGRFKGAELRGRTLGLVGAGRVGQEVAQRCRAFGMHVVVSDPYLTDERAKELGLDRADLGTVIESADVLSLHVPLTDDTRGMIDQKIISRMKKSAFIVNVSRGQVIDEAALAVALNEERIAGAALDVYENEPLEDDSPLRKAPGVVLTPHLGASTLEAQELVATEISGAVKAALLEGDLSHALNAPAFGGATLQECGPVFALGQRLGILACALARGGIRGIEVRYSGELEEVLPPLTAYVLMGLLKNIMGSRKVNFVSAGYLARQRGIGISQAHLSRRTDYSEFVEIIVKAEGEDLRLAGALLGDLHARIVRIRDYHVDIVPDGTLIVLRNQDVPGVIGRVGTLLGAHAINIAEYHQARLTAGGEAIAAIAVDGTVDSKVRDALVDLPEVSTAVVVKLS